MEKRSMGLLFSWANVSCMRQESVRRFSSASLIHPYKSPTNSIARGTIRNTRFRDIKIGHSTSARPYSAQSTAEPEALARTDLYDLHVKNGGKMVPFAGYSMPLQYGDLSVGESHHWTREKASLFDVGHMVQQRISGPAATTLLEKITPTSMTAIQPYHSSLSCFLHPLTGGIVDDTVITRIGPDSFYVVTNAACREKDMAFIREAIASDQLDVAYEILEQRGLLALQGPLSASILQNLITDEPDLRRLYFGQCIHATLTDVSGEHLGRVQISRGGYTGEDGFEISIPPESTHDVANALLSSAGPDQLRLAGLGARDSLRLEAGMCLYGHDLDDTTTPVEAGFSWIISKEQRAAADFNGAEVILPQLRSVKDGGSGVVRRRVGLIVEGAPAREGAQIVSPDGEVIGNITSGCPSPSLRKNIAMGYVKSGSHKAGTELEVLVRGKRRKATVTKMPFVPSRYWRQGTGMTPG